MISERILSGRWQRTHLGEVVEFLDHLRKPVTASERKPGPYPYYGANGQQGSVADYLFDEPLVLLAEDGGYYDDPSRTIAYRVEGKCWVNNHAHVLRPTNRIDVGFLCRLLEHYDVRPYIAGTTRSKLTKGQAERITIAVPPLPEQRRIAAILDKADAIRRKRQEANRLAASLSSALFLDFFGDPVTNPNGWRLRPFGELAFNQDGRRKPVKAADRSERKGEYPYYGASGIIDYVDDYLFDGRSLLISEDGANLVARVTPIAFIAEGKYWVNNHAHVVTDNGEAALDYLAFHLNHRSLKDYVTGTAQPKLNQANLNTIPIPAPPISLQRRFETELKQLKTVQSRGSAHAIECESLFNSLVQRAFRGEL